MLVKLSVSPYLTRRLRRAVLRGFMSIGVAQGMERMSNAKRMSVLRGFMSIGVAQFSA